MGKYGIYYKGQLWARKVTRNGANSMAYQLIKIKEWEAAHVEVKELKINVE